MNNDPVSVDSFGNLGIAPKLLEILQKLKYTKPTPIQAQSIPPAIEGKDLMGIAQTGTGKTLAFGIPMIQRLVQNKGKKGLVILPTRELAIQVDETLRKIGASIGLKTAILIGGESIHKQIKALKRDPHVTIATPGRLIDHLEHTGMTLNNVAVLVLDEADRMLDMGFAPQIKKILDKVPKIRQTMLFSATMPDTIVKIAQSYMNLPLRVEVAPAGTAVKTVTQELYFVDRAEKLSLLKNILVQYKGSVLVFSRTKHGARKISSSIRAMGHTATEIHSNRTLNQRIEALEGFKFGRYRVLVATDIAARGIDVTGIQLVINFDLPATAEDYVHRIGRTGRAGLAGHAISFATSDQRGDVRGIERLIRITLPVSKVAPGTLRSVERVDDREGFTPAPQYSGSRSNYSSSGSGRRSPPHSHGGRQSSSNSNSSNSNFKQQKGLRRGKFKEKFSDKRRDIPTLSRKPAAEGEGYFLKRYKDTPTDY